MAAGDGNGHARFNGSPSLARREVIDDMRIRSHDSLAASDAAIDGSRIGTHVIREINENDLADAC